MATYAFRLLNVFAESTFGGNPLAVFEDARGLDSATMQALARQFNLSETTFILPSACADARMRIFTTGYEMPFAGHPTLGTALVVHELHGSDSTLRLECTAGVVPITLAGDYVYFTAPFRGRPEMVGAGLPDAAMAALLGLRADDLAHAPVWIDTGVDQLMVPLTSIEAVERAAPDSSRMHAWPLSRLGRKSAYVFAFDPAQPARIVCRYFFTKEGQGVAEDPGTGSACANLGGWMLAQQRLTALTYRLEQGDALGRPCRLSLRVTDDGAIEVGGRVITLGHGTITL